MDNISVSAIRNLRKLIIFSGYTDVYLTYGNYHSQKVPHPILRKNYENFPLPLKKLVALFLLGKTCERSFIEDFFDEGELAALISIGVFFEDENESISSPLVLFPYHGYLIFFERFKDGKDISVYMGDDSIALASHLTPPPGGRCLDLCTGSGIQALVCASHSKEIIGIDLQKRAVEVAKINTYLNMLEDRISIHNGNLYHPVEGEKFDLICANPPLLPAPSDLKAPIVADGGEDALGITYQILQGLVDHLNPDGICQIIGTCLGDSEGPFISKKLDDLSKEIKCSINIVFPVSIPVDEWIGPLVANSKIYCNKALKTSRNAYNKLFHKLKATHMYTFYLTAIRHAFQKINVNVINQYKDTQLGSWNIIM
jgi:hypothetical protein